MKRSLFLSAVAALLLAVTATAQTPFDDHIVHHADYGEPEIAQAYERAGTGETGADGERLRADDADDPVDPDSRTYFPGHPLAFGISTDQLDPVILTGGAGADNFHIRAYISGKPAIVEKYVQANGTISWNGVAGENANVHDHWVEYFGTVVITDFIRAERDCITIQGHTVALNNLEHIAGDTVITVQSQQGAGGGAHDEDVLGVIEVLGVELSENEIDFIHTNDGVRQTIDDYYAYIDAVGEIYANGNEDPNAEPEPDPEPAPDPEPEPQPEPEPDPEPEPQPAPDPVQIFLNFLAALFGGR